MVTVAGRRLRVAVLARVVYPWHGYGGLQRHVYDLTRSLLARDIEVTLITQPATRHRVEDAGAESALRDSRLTVVLVPYRTFPFANRRGTTILDRSTAYLVFGRRAGRRAAELVDRGAIDVVHGMGASALGYALARGTPGGRAPFVFNPHGMEEFGATDPSRARLKRLFYWPLRRAVVRTARAADRVIATDQALVGPVLAHLGVARNAVTVVPNAIDLSGYGDADVPQRAAALRAEIGLDAQGVLLLSVGRLEANKGFDVLVRALASLQSDGTLRAGSWRWALVGEGPMKAQLERDISSLALSGSVVLLRASDRELHGWYRAATLFVHPTLYEGSSLVTLEAMAHERAIVATTAGGLPDKITSGVNGWLVPPGDAPALASAIRDALSDAARLARMGVASRAIVNDRFSWDVAARQTIDLYDELLRLPAGQRGTGS